MPPISVTRIFLGSIIVLAYALRFVGLEKSPPGFYIDESAGATQIICLSHEGVSAGGVRHPLFFPEYGAFYTAPYAYFGALWVRVFGESIASFRAVAAFFSCLTVLGLGFLSFLFLGFDGSLLTMLAASTSPWSFQFSRIAWDPPLMPCFLVWGLYFFLRPWRRDFSRAFSLEESTSLKASKFPETCDLREFLLGSCFAGILTALAMYAYPPARVMAPLLFAGLFLALFFSFANSRRILLYRFAAFGVTVILVSLPLIIATLNGQLQGRFNMLSIFSPNYLGFHPLDSAIGTLVRNMFLHFSPRYLFFSGDQNLRHSTQFSGVLSWLDIVALGCVLFRNKRKKCLALFAEILIGTGIVAGILPAAMTWESLPHSLRSIGAQPFFALLTGLLLSKTLVSPFFEKRKALVGISAGVVASVFFYFYIQNYFEAYPQISKAWFDTAVKEEAQAAQLTGDWSHFAETIARYGDDSARYFLIHYGGETCSSSVKRLEELRKNLSFHR